MQQAMYQTSPTKNGATPSSSKTLSMVLAAHQIEPELRVLVPRPVAARNRVRESAGVIAAAVIFAVATAFCSSFFMHPVPVLIASPIAFALGYALIRTKHRRHKDLLTYGTPRAAVVIQVEPMADANSMRVTYIYETAANPRFLQTMILSKAQITAFDLRRWKSFTLLVSDRDEYDIEPYFLVDAYKLHEGTLPGTTRIPTLPFHRKHGSGAIAATFGVEPELYSAAPRYVLWKRGTHRMRLWFVNICAAIGILAFHEIKTASEKDAAVAAVAFGILLAMVLLAWLICEGEVHKSRFLLQQGFAIQATVTECREGYEGEIYVSYEYPRNASETGRSGFSVSDSEALRLGGFEVGTRFTVLRHPTESFTVMPYFQIGGVEIPGARPAQTTPPINAGVP